MTTATALQTSCRSCGRSGLELILSYGPTPLSEVLLTEEQLGEPEPTFPLDLAVCPDCALVQMVATVPPELLYKDDYPYYSSVSSGLLKHFTASAESLIESRDLGPQSLVIEAASNDGYMLKVFADRSIPVLGIDPAGGPARAAEAAGVPTLVEFFDLKLARRLAGEGRKADVLLANNVLNLVPDLDGFAEGVRVLLKPGAVAVLEVPYVGDLIDRCEFDTVFHQNLSYFSLIAIDRLFRRHGLFTNDVQRWPMLGGSLRLFIEPREAPSDGGQADARGGAREGHGRPGLLSRLCSQGRDRPEPAHRDDQRVQEARTASRRVRRCRRDGHDHADVSGSR